jgi:hypothetical protein
MRESPRGFSVRTGQPPPTTDVRVASALLGTTARPLAPDEPCPTLFRDVGPQALHLFLNGKLARLGGPDAGCVFLRDATLPGFSGVVRELGVLAFLQPLALGPWFSGQPGIYVAEPSRMPPPATLGFVPRVESIAEIDRKIADAPDTRAMREALGGATYDEAVAAVTHDLSQYLEAWQHVERESRPWRAIVQGHSDALREAALRALHDQGLHERDLSVPLFQLSKTKRAELAQKLAALAATRAALEVKR